MILSKFKLYIPFLLAFIIAFIGFFVGSFLDLDISQSLSNQGSLFAILLTATGNMPSIFIGIFASCLVIFLEKQTKVGKILCLIIGIGGLLAMSLFLYSASSEYAEYEIMKDHELLYKLILAIFIFAVDLVIIFFTYKTINKFEPKETLRIAILMLGVVWFYAGFTEVVKYLASRPRPRIVLSGEETFRYWYEWRPLYALFNGSNHKSFVSGHTSNSICLVSLLPLLMSLTKLKDKKYTYQISAYIGLVFTLIVGFSRIIASAHFLTDVVGGILISSIIQVLVLTIVPKIKFLQNL